MNELNEVKKMQQTSSEYVNSSLEIDPYLLELDSLKKEAMMKGEDPNEAAVKALFRRSVSPLGRNTLNPKSILKQTNQTTKRGASGVQWH